MFEIGSGFASNIAMPSFLKEKQLHVKQIVAGGQDA